MNSDIKKSLDDLVAEIKNDICFFGFCGVIVGMILTCSVLLEYIGVCKDIDLASMFFKEFISAKIFMFFLIVYFSIGITDNLSKHKRPFLNKAVAQAKKRFYQTGSSIISFVAGFLPFILFFWLKTYDVAARKLLIVLLFFIPFIAMSVVTVELISRRENIIDGNFCFSIIALLLSYYAIYQFGS
ncbi:hypothetical protein [Candidatus Electronema sp. JM]|uniref:hypothetical protein n=1 Tax=Candidatus Electronema sp. JM TaxID=3401571 RepID=UPI003AA81D03